MAVVREFTISYAGQSMAGAYNSGTLHLHEVHRLEKGSEDATVIFEVLLSAATPVILAAMCIAFETLFTTRRGALLVGLDGTNVLTLQDSDNSGFDVTPSCEKVGATSPQYDTNTSRMYEVTITCGLQALGTSGRRELEYDVRFSPTRRGTLVVRGTYTAAVAGPTQAAAVYLAGIAARVATITSALGGTWELDDEVYTPDDQDQVTRFERTYEEVIFNQSSGTLNHASIVGAILEIGREKVTAELTSPSEGTSGGTTTSSSAVTPLERITAEYSTGVDKTVTTDLVSLWENTIRPFILAQMEVVAGASLAIERASPLFNFRENEIRATIEGFAISSSTVLEREIVVEDEVDFGKIVRETWPSDKEVPDDEQDEFPSPTPAYVYQGARVISRVVTTKSLERLGGVSVGIRNHRSLQVGQVPVPAQQSGSGSQIEALLMRRKTRVKKSKRGLREFGNQISLTERTTIELFRIVVNLSQEGSGGGTQVGTTRTRGGSAGR